MPCSAKLTQFGGEEPGGNIRRAGSGASASRGGNQRDIFVGVRSAERIKKTFSDGLTR